MRASDSSKAAGSARACIAHLLYYCRADYYDKPLFAAISANISANFTKFETEQLLKVTGCAECRSKDALAHPDSWHASRGGSRQQIPARQPP